VIWGWNEGRQGVLYLNPGHTNVRIAFGTRTGRQTLFIRAVAGGPITLGTTSL